MQLLKNAIEVKVSTNKSGHFSIRDPMDHIAVGVQKTALWQSIRHNIPFYTVLLVCISVLAWAGERSLQCTFLTFVFISFFSFWMMYMSKNASYTTWYDQCDTLLTRCSFMDNIMQGTTYHPWSNYVFDVLKAGGYVILIKWILNLANNKAIVFWALLYPTVHNINYLYLKPLAHMEHHVDPHTNYGMDMWDLIFGTKHDWSKLEVHNHAAINCVFITAFILWLWKK